MAKQQKQPADEQDREDQAPDQRQDEQPEEEQEERLSHWQAAHRVVKKIDGDTTLSELAYDADKLVVASGGKSNEDRAYSRVYEVLQSLAELGVVELTEEVSVHPLQRLAPANGQK